MSTVIGEDMLADAYVPTWRPAVAAELMWVENACSRAAEGQAESVRVWRTAHLGLTTAAVLASGVAGSLMLVGSRHSGHSAHAGALALGAALLVAVAAMIGPSRREVQAANAAKVHRVVESLARQARLVDLPGRTFTEARAVLADLTGRWEAAEATAPHILRLAQLRADRALRRRGPDAPAKVRVLRVWPLL